MKRSKGNWKVGRPGTVVTDNGEGFPGQRGYDDLEYYGGYLIAESILKKADAQIMAAAPEMLAILKKITSEAREAYERGCQAAHSWNNSPGVGIHFDYKPMPSLPAWYESVIKVINKAEGENE